MTSSSNSTGNATITGPDPQIEHHNRTLPLTPEELAENLPQPRLAEQFEKMQEHLLVMEANKKELEGRI